MGIETETERKASLTEALNWDLTQRQKIWILFIIPTALHCAVYIADIATDIALVERHMAEQRCFKAVLTLFIIYLPASAFLLLTVHKKPDDPEEGVSEKALWCLKQCGFFLLFPIHAIHRFAGKLFWGFEALYGPEDERADAMNEARKTSYAEMYLLLQAFLQALPQAFFQTLFMASYKVPHERTGIVQILSVATSLMSAAIAAACYMRFETQRENGRIIPWAEPENTQPHRQPKKSSLQQKESLMTTIDSQMTSSETREASPEPEDATKSAPLPKGVPQSAILSLPPLPNNIRARLLKASGDELPEELQNEVADEGEHLNIRSSLYGNKDVESLNFSITLPESMAVGSMESPPGSPGLPSPFPGGSPLHETLPPLPGTPPENFSEQPTGTATPDTLLNSQEPLLESTASVHDRPPTPTPIFVPILNLDGLSEGKQIGQLIAFIWWYLFIGSRVLALATLAFFYPWPFVGITLLHFLLMLSYIFSCAKDNTSPVIRIALAVVFLFCFIEVRVKFRDQRSFAIGFVILCALENLVTSVLWFYVTPWTSWWFVIVFYLINTSMFLSIIAIGAYHMVLKKANEEDVTK